MNMRVGSPKPKVQLVQTQGVARPQEKQAMQQVTVQLKPSDVDVFLHARSQLKQRGMLPTMSKLLDTASPSTGGAKSIAEQSHAVQAQLHTAVNELADVYRDGLITEPELSTLSQAKNRLDHIAALFEPAVLNMLPRDVRERIQDMLMPAVDELRGAAGRREGRMYDGIQKNLAWVQQNPTPEYGFVSPKLLAESGNSVSGIDRYAAGDMISVPRSDGSASLGVVRENNGDHVVAEFLDVSGQVATKKLSAQQVVEANPLKIGDCIDIPNGRVWVTGTSASGITGVVQDGQGRQDRLGHGELKQLSQSIAHQLGALRQKAAAPTVQMAAVAPVAAQAAAKSVETQIKVGAGGYESTMPERVQGNTVSGAFFTWRGIGYADYNEDGAVLGVIGKGNGVAHETGFAGAFDQAGGMGHAAQTGAASQIAAQKFEQAAKDIAAGKDPEATLKAAVQAAHVDVNALRVGAATTFAAAVVQNGVAHLVNCGDSGVMVFDKNGRLKGQTEAHNLGDLLAKQSGDPNAGLNFANQITTCIGGGEAPQADYSRLNVEKGDVIICVSDGVGDANLAGQKADWKAGKPWTELNGERTTREIGQLVAGKDAAALTQAIIDYTKEHVLDGRGKKDNVTASVMIVS